MMQPYYFGRKNNKTRQDRLSYWRECRAQDKVAIFVYQLGKANSRVEWDADSINPRFRSFVSQEKEAFNKVCFICEKYTSKSTWGGHGVKFGTFTLSNKDAIPFAKELREFLDEYVKVDKDILGWVVK
jgi:hypothetical protein